MSVKVDGKKTVLLSEWVWPSPLRSGGEEGDGEEVLMKCWADFDLRLELSNQKMLMEVQVQITKLVCDNVDLEWLFDIKWN